MSDEEIYVSCQHRQEDDCIIVLDHNGYVEVRLDDYHPNGTLLLAFSRGDAGRLYRWLGDYMDRFDERAGDES